MKIFISWSGDFSHNVAKILREWLSLVFHSVDPYVSSEDIKPGERWLVDITKELEDSFYGILCVTSENINSPWLNYEAGAISKTVDKSFVSPLLIGINREEVKGPILQFQSVGFNKEDMRKLIQGINNSCKEINDKGKLDITFERFWPDLEEKISGLFEQTVDPVNDKEKSDNIKSDSLLAEILLLLRNQQRRLNSPEALLPIDYLKGAIPKVVITSNSKYAELYEKLETIKKSWEKYKKTVRSIKISDYETASALGSQRKIIDDLLNSLV